MKGRFLIAVLIVASAGIGLVSPARADYVQDELNRANNLIGETNRFNDNVLKPASDEAREELNQLLRSCMNGNTSACNEHGRRLEQINQNLDDMIYQTRLQQIYRSY